MSEYKIVRMEVNVTVIPPEDSSMSDSEAINAAMATVSQRMEREFGRDIGPNHNMIAWAKLYAEVSENDCEVIEEGDV